MELETINFIVDGGKVSQLPSIASKLSALKLDSSKIFKEINEMTKEYQGMKIPVRIFINKDGTYKIDIGTPTTADLIKKELGIEIAKLTEEHKSRGENTIGSLSFEQVLKIAKIKMKGMLVKDLKAAVKQVVGTCSSMPILIENKKAKEIMKEIKEGKYDKILGR